MKPMLAATIKDIADVKYPVYGSPKLDGIRGVVVAGTLKSRTLKVIPNGHVSARFSRTEFDGLDGELILGDPTAKDVYRQSNGACARHEGTPDVKFYVFDDHRRGAATYSEWVKSSGRIKNPNIVVCEQTLINNGVELLQYEADCLDFGYEGVILRSPDGEYKFGRSTMTQQGMMKLKRFTDSEAEILEVLEELENTNEKKTNELGRSKRSSHAAGKVGKDTAGGFRARDIKSGVEFVVGSGLTDEDGRFYWANRKAVVGHIIKYKSFLVGVKDKPRHPVYLGPREKWDL